MERTGAPANIFFLYRSCFTRVYFFSCLLESKCFRRWCLKVLIYSHISVFSAAPLLWFGDCPLIGYFFAAWVCFILRWSQNASCKEDELDELQLGGCKAFRDSWRWSLTHRGKTRSHSLITEAVLFWAAAAAACGDGASVRNITLQEINLQQLNLTFVQEHVLDFIWSQ